MTRRLLAALMIPTLAAPAAALDPGERLFGLHCSACHGSDARGSGALAKTLGEDPADLTRLARLNGGAFPVARAAARIDGRAPLAAHGGQMPVYGWFFDGPAANVEAPDGTTVVTTEAVAHILRWLQTVQR